MITVVPGAHAHHAVQAVGAQRQVVDEGLQAVLDGPSGGAEGVAAQDDGLEAELVEAVAAVVSKPPCGR